MAFPTVAEVKAAVTQKEIAPFVDELIAQLKTEGTAAYLAEPTITNKVISRTFVGKSLSDEGILALAETIQDAGWTSVNVDNQPQPSREGIGQSNANPGVQVFVSFKPGTTPAPAPTTGGSGS